MEFVLAVVTVASLGLTIVLAGILARLMRNERRRSNARVALLRELADGAAPQYEDPDPADEVELTQAAMVHSAAELFAYAEPRSAWPRRVAVAATIASIAGLVAIALPSRSSSPGAAARPDPGTASAHTVALLELLSLGQTQDAGAITITGLVQNPRDGAELSKIRATALLFGPDGTYLASGGAPLDFTVLRPGDESGFVIRVPVTSPVARYRVGFRNEDGRVIGHIDRRSAATMADDADSRPDPTERLDAIGAPDGRAGTRGAS